MRGIVPKPRLPTIQKFLDPGLVIQNVLEKYLPFSPKRHWQVY